MGMLLRDLRMARDRVAFARTLGLEPDAWQEDLLRSEARRIILNASRQSGKTTMTGVIALHQALYHPGSLVLILAPSERQSKESYQKVARLSRHTSSLGYAILDSDRKTGAQFANGSRIEALPGTEGSIRGYSGVDLLIVDEASRVSDELYYAVRPMLAVSDGRLMLLSTPYGRRGIFYETWVDSDGARHSFERYEIPANQCPRISEAFLEEERRALPRRVYRQEYECSFEDIEGAVFAAEDIQAAMSADVKPLFPVGDPVVNLEAVF